jgi:hypothetical protein
VVLQCQWQRAPEQDVFIHAVSFVLAIKKRKQIRSRRRARPGQARSEAGDDFTLSKRSQRLTWIAVGCDTVRTTSKQQLLAHRSTNLCNKGGGAATEAYIQKLADEIIDMAMTRNIDAC